MLLKSFDGTKIYYHIKRNPGTALVFVHGWANNWTVWKKELEFFQRKGYSTVAIDLRGHGRSGKPEGKSQYSMRAFARDIKAVVDEEKIAQYVLIGHSMGGMIALTYQSMFKGAKAMVLCSTASKGVLEHTRIRKLAPFVKRVLDFLIAHDKVRKMYFSHLKTQDLAKDGKIPDALVFFKGLHNTALKSVFACLESMLDCDLTSALRKITVPVLIIEGEKDKLLPKVYSYDILKGLKNSEMAVIPEGRHFINVEYPKKTSKIIMGFLAKHNLDKHGQNR